MLRFRLFGIPIFVQPFFWVIMALFGGGVEVLQTPSSQGFVNVIVFIAAGFLSVLVHEMGHALVNRRYGRHPHIILHGLGGVAISQGPRLSRVQNILMIAAGPGLQILLGIIALIIIRTVGPEDSFPTQQSYHFVHSLMYISIAWAVLNLIPIYPLDGGQILSNILGPRRSKITHIVSIVVGVGAILLLLLGGSLPFFAILILGMLVYDNIRAIKR